MSNESRVRYLESLLDYARDDVASELARLETYKGYPTYDQRIAQQEKLLEQIDAALRDRLGAVVNESFTTEDCPHSALDGCQCFKDGRLAKGDEAP